jgi:DNA-binding beta-propeller fold protein YncE
MKLLGRSVVLGLLCALAIGVAASAAQAAPGDPIFIYRPAYKPPPPGQLPPPPIPPPTGSLSGPCGIAVDEVGNLYLSDYYHRVVDLLSPAPTYLDQLTETDPLDGPCGLATDSIGNLYVNDYHRNVSRYSTSPFDAGTVIDGAPLNDAHPTGVAVDPDTNDVYVNERTRIAVYDSGGTRLGQIGEGTIEDGYGLAFSEGRLYVPDAATNTVKAYEATLGATDPVATIDGSGTPKGHFTSLRDSAIAVDNASGEIYVADNLQPGYTEQPEAVVYVFNPTDTYKGRLKYSVADALPVGLAVDNSAESTQGRVYVTSGNTEGAALYGYGPGAATATAVPLPTPSAGAGGGSGALGSTTAAPATAALAPASALSASTTPSAKRPTHRHHKQKHRHRSDKREAGR